MVNIIRISRTQPPPTGPEWVLIARNGGAPFIATGKAHRHEPVRTIGEPTPDLEAVLDEAWKWAQAHGVRTIYLQDH